MAESITNGSLLAADRENVFISPSLPTQGQSTPDPDAPILKDIGFDSGNQQQGHNPLNWSDDDVVYSNTTNDGVTIEDKTQDSSINDFLYQGSNNRHRKPLQGNDDTTNQSEERLTDEPGAAAENFERYHAESKPMPGNEQSPASKQNGGSGLTTEEEEGVEKSKESLEGEFSDGYFDRSIDKIYERYNKSKQGTIDNTSSGLQSLPTDSSHHTPTGCFDNTRDNYDNQNCQQPFYKRYTFFLFFDKNQVK